MQGHCRNNPITTEVESDVLRVQCQTTSSGMITCNHELQPSLSQEEYPSLSDVRLLFPRLHGIAQELIKSTPCR